jgi:HK97 family phage major capsid protein
MAIIDAGFRSQFGAHMLNEKLRGKGGDQYLGILTALAATSLGPTISVAKEVGQVADTIVTNNVLKMRSRCWGYEQAIWLANHDTYPQLGVMSIGIGAAGALVYQQSVVSDRPATLLGRPIFFTEYAATVGDQGDIILANCSQFLEGIYQPLQSAESVHVRFVNHERTFKFWVRNAGAPWWRSALTPNKSSSTLSPFVVLDARA